MPTRILFSTEQPVVVRTPSNACLRFAPYRADGRRTRQVFPPLSMQAAGDRRGVSAWRIVARVIAAGSRWRCEISARQRSIGAIPRDELMNKTRGNLEK